MEQLATIQHGFIEHMSFEDYCEIKAANKSGLDYFDQSPAHFWEACVNPERAKRKETDAMYIGTAVHAAILEPEKFAKDYRPQPLIENYKGALVSAEDFKNKCAELGLKVSGTKAEMKKRILESKPEISPVFFEDILDQFKGFKMLSAVEMETCAQISDNIRSKAAGRYLFNKGKAELTMLWNHGSRGIPVVCKARLDWLNMDGFLVDIKSTEDASPKEFARSILNYGYHRQAAFYLDGFEIITGTPAKGFIFAAFEKKPPYACAFYIATDEMIRKGRRDYMTALSKYKHCLDRDEWPGYPEEILPIGLPDFMNKRTQPEVF